MNIVVAPDSFKECLSSKEVAAAISKGILGVLPKAKVFEIPISDGGEGVLEAILSSTEGTIVSTEVLDPLLRPIKAVYAILKDGKTAVIEMAKASGLELLSQDEKNPLLTSTFGTGQLIANALDKGCTKIIIGIGGSATNDGGVGMINALGGKFLNLKGKELAAGGGHLNELHRIDLSGFDPRIQNCEVLVACDVFNPLTGANGASLIYGGQKGGNKSELHRLDKNLKHYAEIIKKDLGIQISNVPGSGAAGGIGAALMVFLNGNLVNGIELILETIGIEAYIKNADLVITGEGKIDEQTLNGKTIMGIAKSAKLHDVPVIVLTGKIGDNIEPIYNMGVNAIYAIVNCPMKLSEAITDAAFLLENCTKNVIRTIQSFKSV